MPTTKISLLLALLTTHARAFSLQAGTANARNDTPRLGLRARGGGEEEERRIRGSGLDRGDFLRAAGAAALSFTAAAELTIQPSLAVLRQPGQRTTQPPNALLLVPALRAKVCRTYHGSAESLVLAAADGVQGASYLGLTIENNHFDRPADAEETPGATYVRVEPRFDGWVQRWLSW